MVQKFIFLLRSPVRNSCWRNATDVANIFTIKSVLIVTLNILTILLSDQSSFFQLSQCKLY